MSTLQVSKLESLIHEKICTLSYVSGVGYTDDGREVAILVVHDDVGNKILKWSVNLAAAGQKWRMKYPIG